MHAREKRNARNRFYPCVCCIFCVRALRYFDLRRAYGSLETNLKSVFVCLHTVSKLYATDATQRTHGLRCNQKTKYTTHARKKNTPHAINSMLCVRCVFWRFSRAYVALRTIAWKPTFKSVFCILMAAALFRRSARLHQPAIAKFLFHDR